MDYAVEVGFHRQQFGIQRAGGLIVCAGCALLAVPDGVEKEGRCTQGLLGRAENLPQLSRRFIGSPACPDIDDVPLFGLSDQCPDPVDDGGRPGAVVGSR